ncbi:MAG: DUF6527 family protein [Rhodothermales bacterium]
MTKRTLVAHAFVDFIPDEFADGVIYVSIQFATAAHKCCCGCGSEVVTPLSPTDWSLTFNGETISLSPSIGNWSFPCQSHYWIRENKVVWAAGWTREEIERGRAQDRTAKDSFFDECGRKRIAEGEAREKPRKTTWMNGVIERIRNWLW